MKPWTKDPFPPTPDGFHRRMAQTLDQLQQGRAAPRSSLPLAAIVAAVLLLTAMAACAATLLCGQVDWNGRFTPAEQKAQAWPSPTPMPQAGDGMAQSQTAHEILKRVPQGDYWYVRLDHGGVGSMRMSLPQGEKALEALLAHTPYPVPSIPEGYTVEDFRGVLRGDVQAISTLYSQEEINGLSVSKYRLPETLMDDADGYSIDLRNGDKWLWINVMLLREEEWMDDPDSFPVNEGECYRLLKVAGADRALTVGGAGASCRVYLLCEGAVCPLRIALGTNDPQMTPEALAGLLDLTG